MAQLPRLSSGPVHDFAIVSQPKTMSLLGLPYSIRQKIYTYAGLVRVCTIDILHESQPKQEPGWFEDCAASWNFGGSISPNDPVDCYCPRLPIALLRVSRQIYDETLATLYGLNHFAVFARNVAQLRVIRAISPAGLGSLQSLLIRLNCWPCPKKHDAYSINHKNTHCRKCGDPITDADPSLSSKTLNGRQLIQAWNETLSYLAKLILPANLHLSLVADVLSEEDADMICSALSQLPQLKQLDLRLGRNKNYMLTRIAQEVTAKMTGKPLGRAPFDFGRLPTELQVRILELTELTSSKSLEDMQRASSRKPFSGRDPVKSNIQHPHCYVKRDERIFIRENKRDPRGGQRWTRFVCCRNCTLSEFGCCCPTLYAATSTYCTCRLLPLELFYVSQSVSKMALRIFYSQNEFVFNQTLSQTGAFIKSLPPLLAGWIRNVTIMIKSTGIERDDVVYASSQEAELKHLFEVVKARLNLSKIALTLSTRQLRDLQYNSETSEKIYKEHVKTAQYLHVLRGARRLSFGGCGSIWNEELTRQVRGGKVTSYDRFRKREKALEIERTRRAQGPQEMPYSSEGTE